MKSLSPAIVISRRTASDGTTTNPRPAPSAASRSMISARSPLESMNVTSVMSTSTGPPLRAAFSKEV